MKFAKSYSTYSNSVMIRRQKHVLKKVMWRLADFLWLEYSKMYLKIIGLIKMRLNYQSSSSFESDYICSWFQLLYEYLRTSMLKIYVWGIFCAETLLIVFRKHCERISLLINIYLKCKKWVPYATGEVLNFKRIKDGRGFVVPSMHKIIGKEPKYFVRVCYFLGTLNARLYFTRCRIKNLDSVQNQRVKMFVLKGFNILAKHWKNCFDNPAKVFYDLRGLLKNESLWFLAYFKLSSKKKFKKWGFNCDNIDVLAEKRILELRDSVRDREFSWINISKIEILKYKKSWNTRSLDFFLQNIFLIQEVLKLILKPIWVPFFDFQVYNVTRDLKSHLVFKAFKIQMQDSIWFIKSDIKTYFDTINYVKLLKFIERKVKDQRILKLLKSIIKTSIFLKSKDVFSSKIGSLYNGILSSLFYNIYLHIFDTFIIKLKNEYERNVKKEKSEVSFLLNNSLKTEDYCNNDFNTIFDNPNGFKVKYIRYANNYIIGILGPKTLAVIVRNRIKEFLMEEFQIELSVTKAIKITHISNQIKFFGFIFSRKILDVKPKYFTNNIIRKVTTFFLDVDMKYVIGKLHQAGFCNRNGNPIPVFKFLKMPQAYTNFKVNIILRNFNKWWSIARNRKQAIARVAYIIRYSVAKMYAAKFKMQTVATVFKKGKNDLSLPLGVKLKSVIGTNINWTKIEGILFDKYHKIPKSQFHKLKYNWEPKSNK
nr:hypothetical protein Paeru_mt_16 [Porphyridium aerugineum]